jgi:lysozyme family protein
MFWKDIRGDELPLDVATVLCDTAVNFGRPKAVMMLQEILKVPTDGTMRPGTLEAIRNYKGDLVGEYLNRRLQQYEQRVKERPDLRPALEGWRNRVNRLHYYIDYGPPALRCSPILSLSPLWSGRFPG